MAHSVFSGGVQVGGIRDTNRSQPGLGASSIWAGPPSSPLIHHMRQRPLINQSDKVARFVPLPSAVPIALFVKANRVQSDKSVLIGPSQTADYIYGMRADTIIGHVTAKARQ